MVWYDPGRLLLGVSRLSRLGRQTIAARARAEPLGDPHSHTGTQVAISTVNNINYFITVKR